MPTFLHGLLARAAPVGWRFALGFIVAAVASPLAAQSNKIIETFVGKGLFGGDSGPATSAYLNRPEAVAVDGAGNIYIADTNNHRIRKVDASTGNISTVAGSGTSGFSGDGGAASSARLNFPRGVAVDGDGNLYIVDTSNHRIRKVDASSGNISTVAGSGTSGFSGDGGAASSAQLNFPRGVAVDGDGNLYVVDTSNHRIRKVDASTGNISTVAGSAMSGFSGDGGAASSAQLNFPRGVAVDGDGNLYVVDTSNHRIRKVDASSGNISTVAGSGTSGFSGDGGAATSAALNGPKRVAVDSAGNIYIADTANARIRKVNASDGNISTVAGLGTAGFSGDGGAATSAQFRNLSGVAVDSAGNIYIADTGNDRIRKVDASDGNISTAAGSEIASFSGDGRPATSATLSTPYAVAVDGAGNLYIADQGNDRIRKVDASTGNISTVAGLLRSNSFGGDGGPATSAQLSDPRGVAVDGAGNLYIADRGNDRIRKVDVSTGNISTVAGSAMSGFSGDGGAATSARLNKPEWVAVDSANNLYIADTGNDRIRKVDASTGNISTVAGSAMSGFSGDGGAATSARLNRPAGVAVDGADNLYIVDGDNARIRKVDASTGNISTVAGFGVGGPYSAIGGAATSLDLRNVTGVAVDGTGNLYIVTGTQAGTASRVIKVVTPTGVSSQFAGTGASSFSGDGGPATSAQLNNPIGVAADSAGNIYIADNLNHRIRKVDASTGKISTFAGGTVSPSVAVTSVTLQHPTGVVADGTGNLYIVDQGNRQIRRVDASTGKISTFASKRIPPYNDGTDNSFFAATELRLPSPGGVAVDGAGNIYIAGFTRGKVWKVDASTGITLEFAGTGTLGFSGDGGPADSARLRGPRGVAADGAGNIYIVDQGNHRIRKVDASTGNISTVAGSATSGFSGDGGPATSAQFNSPRGVAADGAGNIYIADTFNRRIRKVDASGNISTIAGTGTFGFSGDGGPATSAELGNPEGVAVDGAGNIYIADTFNHRVRKVDASGNISTIAGTGTFGFSGDGGPPTSARLYNPQGVAVDGSGNIYIADTFNHRIRRIRRIRTAPPPPNEPPVAVEAFEDAALEPGERLEIPLSGKFRDPEGDALTYSAATSNAEVAEAGVSDGQLWVEGRSPGTARVVVTATDAGGLRAFSGFLVQVGVVVSFAADASAPEGGTLRLRLVASQPAPENLSVAYALAAAGDEASAADESDHDGGSGGTATIASGEMEAVIEIGILDDARVEPPREFFALVLSPPPADAGYVLGLKTRAQATIEEGVCDRAAPVRDALRGRGGCAAVADLSSLLVLDLAGSGAEALSALSAEDFLGLSGLRVLDLSGNRLSSWPSEVLAGLPNLISLRLNGNRLRELPAGALAAHPRLIGLHLAGNALSALPPGAFRELAELRRLDLSGNALSALPGDAIAGLSGLWTLRLNGNLLSALPAGLFEGVSGLRELWLQGNPGAPFVLRLELARTDAEEPWAPGPASVAARVAEGAPFALRSLLTASGEALPEGAALSVPAGAIASEPAMLPQGEASLVWARLAGAPPVPDDECELADGSFVPCFQGIATAVGSPLALFKQPPGAAAPIESQALQVDGDALRLDLADRFEAAPGELLTYAAESSDPSVVRARIENGTLIAEAVGEGVATLVVTATDGDGLSTTLRFAVQSWRTARSHWRGWRLILLEP